MSTKSNEINDKNPLSTYIKLENDTDDDLIYENSLELNHQKDYYSTSTSLNPSITSAYKGKIEVTSKGRRKIFDGVRWQILCRRPECRKQTNKKSLCITHYKEEYESNNRWSNSLSSFQLPSYQQRISFDNTKTRIEIDDQNNTISTTDINDNDEQILFNPNLNNRSFHDGYIKYMHNGRRFILKNSKWQPLCKYDDICRNMAKYESLCIKHYEITQKKRGDKLKIHNNDNQRLHSIFNKYHSSFTNDKTKRLKANDFPIPASSIIEQFDINSNENSCSSTEPVDTNLSSLTSKIPNNELTTSSNKSLNIASSDYSSKSNSPVKTDQSVQTDLTIPLCCILHQEDHHSFSSSCINNKLTSSISTKSEPQSIVASFSI